MSEVERLKNIVAGFRAALAPAMAGVGELTDEEAVALARSLVESRQVFAEKLAAIEATGASNSS